MHMRVTRNDIREHTMQDIHEHLKDYVDEFIAIDDKHNILDIIIDSMNDATKAGYVEGF